MDFPRLQAATHPTAAAAKRCLMSVWNAGRDTLCRNIPSRLQRRLFWSHLVQRHAVPTRVSLLHPSLLATSALSFLFFAWLQTMLVLLPLHPICPSSSRGAMHLPRPPSPVHAWRSERLRSCQPPALCAKAATTACHRPLQRADVQSHRTNRTSRANRANSSSGVGHPHLHLRGTERHTLPRPAPRLQSPINRGLPLGCRTVCRPGRAVWAVSMLMRCLIPAWRARTGISVQRRTRTGCSSATREKMSW